MYTIALMNTMDSLTACIKLYTQNTQNTQTYISVLKSLNDRVCTETKSPFKMQQKINNVYGWSTQNATENRQRIWMVNTKCNRKSTTYMDGQHKMQQKIDNIYGWSTQNATENRQCIRMVNTKCNRKSTMYMDGQHFPHLSQAFGQFYNNITKKDSRSEHSTDQHCFHPKCSRFG